jgi:hypothetical protein
MIEAMLFTSGRPIVIVPPDWERGARLEKRLGWKRQSCSGSR